LDNIYFLFYSFLFFFSSRRRHTRCYRDWSSDVCSSDLYFKSASLRAFSLERHAAHSGNLLELFADRLRIERSVSRADLHKHGLRSAGAALQVAHRVRRYQSSFVDNDHLLAGLLDLRENVRAQNDGMVASKTLDQIPRLIDLLRLEPRRRFVQYDYVGIGQKLLL